MSERNFLAELRRRNVPRAAAFYAAGAWLLVQVATQVFPFFHISDWIVRWIIVAATVGFPFWILFAWYYEWTPQGLQRESEIPVPASPVARRQRQNVDRWIIAMLSVAVVLLLANQFIDRRDQKPSASAPGVPQESIAVLPFDNRSADKANSYLADGIQDEILTRLSKIDDLKVISRTSTLRYKSSPENLREIAKQLGVSHVLEGSVQRVGDQLRVNVQLINAQTDAHVWAEVYDRKLADILAVQTDIAGTVAKALRLKLSSREQQAMALRPTENPEAYDAYLRGLAIWNGLNLAPENLQTMTEAYSRAVDLDPNFAIAWANLSVAQTTWYATYDPTATRQAEAKRALDNAMKLQPDLGDGWFALGLYRYRALADFDGALQAFEQALERGANRTQALEFSATVKRRQGKWDEALALHRRSAEIDPRNPFTFTQQAGTFRGLRKFAEAHAALDRALAILPDSQDLFAAKAMIYQAEGNFEAAGRLIEPLAIDATEPQLLQPRFTQLMAAGKFADAVALLQQLLATSQPLPDNLRAVYLTHLGLARRLAGDMEGGTRDLTQGRDEMEAFRQKNAVGEGYLEDLMMVEAVLGNRAVVDQYAARLQKQIARDAWGGPVLEMAIALSRAQLGQADEAIALLRDLLQKPGDDCITTALLRTDPVWIPLHNDPRFQKLTTP